MARKLRIEFPGAIYHVTIRGVGRTRIFIDDRDRGRFLDRLAMFRDEHGVRIYMFCLMGNHAHILLETPEANLGKFMHRLQTAYTVFFNLKHSRNGHLFQGRYGAVLVEDDEYLLNMSRYLHLNPVRLKSMSRLPLKDRVVALRKYRWSSYPGYIEETKKLAWVDYGPALAMMCRKRDQRRSEYRKFVEAGLSETDEEFEELRRKAALSIGSPEFMEKIRDLYADLASKSKHPEDISLRRGCLPTDVETIIAAVCKELKCDEADLRKHVKGSALKAIAARMLCKHAGLSQREVAEVLELKSGAAICTQLKKLEEREKQDTSLASKMGKIDVALQSLRGNI